MSTFRGTATIPLELTPCSRDSLAIEYFDMDDQCGTRTLAEVHLKFWTSSKWARHKYVNTDWRIPGIAITTVALYLADDYIQAIHDEHWSAFSTRILRLAHLAGVTFHFYDDLAASYMVETHEHILQLLYDAGKLDCLMWDDAEDDWFTVEFVVSIPGPPIRVIHSLIRASTAVA